MNFFRTYQPIGFAAVISSFLSLSFIMSAFAADHLEIQIKLNTTWKSQTQTNEHETIAICVVGRNDWYISGQFLKNANVEYWLIGTNVLERKVITSSMYLEQAKDFVSEKIGTKRSPVLHAQYPKKGESSTRTISWLEPFGYGVERSVWLAFCSGSFLHTPERQIPLPIGHFSGAQGYVDKTVLLENQSRFSPPKSVDLCSAEGTLMCRYNVLASTNVDGRAFPLEFRTIQYTTANMSRYILVGKVLSMKPCEKPAVPDMEFKRQE